MGVLSNSYGILEQAQEICQTTEGLMAEGAGAMQECQELILASAGDATDGEIAVAVELLAAAKADAQASAGHLAEARAKMEEVKARLAAEMG